VQSELLAAQQARAPQPEPQVPAAVIRHLISCFLRERNGTTPPFPSAGMHSPGERLRSGYPSRNPAELGGLVKCGNGGQEG